MRRNHAEAQARYRARQSLKLAFFDRMDAERVRRLERQHIWRFADPLSPEKEAVRKALLNHPACLSGLHHLSKTGGATEPHWLVVFLPHDPNSRFCAAVALATLASVSSLPAIALDARSEKFGPDDPAVKQAQVEIAEMKRLGIWERHA